MRGIFVASGLAAVVACSSFSTEDSGTAGGGDAGADGRADLTGIAHAFAISAAAGAQVYPGETTSIVVTITRGGAATGPSTLSIRDLGDKVTAATLTVEESASTASLSITADATALHGLRKAVVVGTNLATGQVSEAPVDLLVRGKPGTLDTSWGSRGLVGLPFPWPAVLGVQPDGKLLAVSVTRSGSTQSQVTRFVENGVADESFGSGLPVTLPMSSTSDAVVMTDPATGRISLLFATLFSERGLCFVRVKANGDLDSSVHGDGGAPGIQEIDEGNGAHAVGVDANGRIYATGAAGTERYASDGTRDSAYGTVILGSPGIAGDSRFGLNGTVVTLGIFNSKPWFVTADGQQQSRGPEAIADAIISPSGEVTTIADQVRRYLGGLTTVDPSWTVTPFPTAMGTASALGLVDRQLYIVGSSRKGSEALDGSMTRLVRFKREGTIDAPGFGTEGFATPVTGELLSRPVVDTLGRIYVAGDNTAGSFVVRYWP